LWASPSLELLEFVDFILNEAHCRALATLQRTDLQVAFHFCSFEPRDARDTFIGWLRNSQVVTELEVCAMEGIISALSGNSSVKRLTINTTDHNIQSLAGVLPGNQGIKSLRIVWEITSRADETLSLLLRSLWAHPRIQSLSISLFNFHSALPAGSKTSRMNALLRMAQCNTVVQIIDWSSNAKDEVFFQNSIVPRLEMHRNYFEDQRQALTRADPSIRGQLLGRALHIVRYNPNLLFRFLLENVPADEDSPSIPIHTITCTGQKRKARP
jgi:hypothetical protein